MGDKGLQMLDESGKVVEDAFDELSAIFSETEIPIPGDEFTGEIAEGSEEEVKVEEKEEEKPELKKAEEEVVELEEKEADLEEKVDASKEERTADQDLQAELRATRKQLAIMKAQVERLLRKGKDGKKEAESEDEDEEFNELEQRVKEVEEEELSDIEVYQKELNNISTSKGEVLETLVATMALNPKYADIEDVCTRQNFDDIFEAAALDLVEKEGGDVATAQLAIELNVWKKANPYAYMYDIIKKYHPNFAETKAVVEPKEEKKEKVKEKKPAEAPLSALDISRGGGDKKAGEWTAEKIDNLSETELSKVPKDIYEMYLRGDLDK